MARQHVSCADTRIARGAFPLIGLLDDFEPAVLHIGQGVQAVIGGAVVHHNEFKVLEALVKDAVNCAPDIGPFFVKRDDNAELR